MRIRANDEIRPVSMTPDFIGSADGSVLVEFGNTRVICTAMAEEKTPPFLAETGRGWVSAEYAMLPASTLTRKQRDRKGQDGRGVEIQRLVGRSLRSVVDMGRLGERTIWLDCDVIQADGGTRAASITGAFVALVLAVDKLMGQGVLHESPIRDYVAAISCGVVDEELLLDLCYEEDSKAQVDANFVMSGSGGIIEIQGTGEKRPMTLAELDELIRLATIGTSRLFALQKQAMGERAARIGRGVF
ncbi:MAG: ribonuclease PH [Christensenellales bacterium]|jgi:ribonuclease PH